MTRNPAQHVLGIDPGTQVTGYGVVVRKGNRLITSDFGCIRPPKNAPLSERYHIIHQGLCVLLEKHQPEAVSVETQYVARNPQSALKLGMARGMVLLAATQHGIPVYEYSPSKAKLAVVGNGRASKAQIQAMVQTLLQLSELPKPEDAADALALAICHLQASSMSLMGVPI